jgi:hypothetical protein
MKSKYIEIYIGIIRQINGRNIFSNHIKIGIKEERNILFQCKDWDKRREKYIILMQRLG